MARTMRPWVAVALLLVVGCGRGGEDVLGPDSQACGSSPYFTVLPVDLSDVNLIAVWGGMGAPGHTLPTAHSGFYLKTEGAQVRSPAAMKVTRLRRVRYLQSPNRQGVEDFAAEFQVCREVSGWFGHLTSIASALQVPESRWGGCQTYSTATETVQSCSAPLEAVTVAAGQSLGTGGESIALGLMGLDFGLRDTRVNNFYITPSRYPMDTFRSICPWDQFTPVLRDQLYAILRDPSRSGMTPGGDPRCGTMEVDVPSTAKGVWVVQGASPQPGNETDYVALADYPYRPQEYLTLSLGPASLGARTVVVPRQPSGRVNRPFEQMTSDGQVYCYGLDPFYPTTSWLIGMSAATELRIRQVNHASGASPCLADPGTWSLTGAVSLVR